MEIRKEKAELEMQHKSAKKYKLETLKYKWFSVAEVKELLSKKKIVPYNYLSRIVDYKSFRSLFAALAKESRKKDLFEELAKECNTPESIDNDVTK